MSETESDANRLSPKKRLIRETAAASANGATGKWQSAQAALESARQSGSRLREADALSMFGDAADPTLHPERALQLLRRAEQIFVANDLSRRAAACRVASARVLYDLGCERSALELSRATLFDEALAPLDRLTALVRIAHCHVRLGEIDMAFGTLREEALPMAKMCREPQALPSWKRALAAINLKAWVCLRFPTLWAGWPDAPAVIEPAPSPASVSALIDDAAASRVGSEQWPDLDMSRHLMAGLSEAPAPALAALSRLSLENVESDPPLAVRGLYFKALILRHRQDSAGALEALANVLALAEPLRLTALTRDAFLQQSRLYESLGDGQRALSAYRRHADLRLRSVIPTCGQNVFAAISARGPASAGVSAGAVARHHQPYPLAPRHVIRAMRFIDQRVTETIRVDDVVRHCGVSRRTLEMAFKASKSVSVSSYIKAGKLEHAAVMLRNTDWSVSQVARCIGYRSANAFSRNFRERFGVNPAIWKSSASSLP